MASVARSFDEIVDEVLRSAGAPGNTTEFRTSVRATVNEEYVDLVRLVDAQQLMRHHTIDMTADTSADSDTPRLLSTLPVDLLEIRFAEWLDKAETPDRHYPLTIKPHQEFLQETQGHARAYDLGVPEMAGIHRLEGARQDLMTSSLAYEVVSDSTADDTGGATPVTLTAHGFADEGRRTPRRATAVLDGTTPVALGSFYWLDHVGISAGATGTITVRQDVGDVTVAQIMPWDRSCRYVVLEFSRALDRALTLQMEYKRMPPLMIGGAGDLPFYLPETGHGLLVLGAMVRGNFYKKLADWKGAQALYQVRRAEWLNTVRPKGFAQTKIRLRR